VAEDDTFALYTDPPATAVAISKRKNSCGRCAFEARSIRTTGWPACSPGIDTFGAWAEQLIAESTGKEGKGLIPIDNEPLAAATAVAISKRKNSCGRCAFEARSIRTTGWPACSSAAESTGKEGKGLIPIDNEPLAAPAAYGNDRVFVQG
jgi:bacterioferritin-associated ferredoxin